MQVCGGEGSRQHCRCFCLQTPSINTNHSLTKLTNRLLLHAQPRSVRAHVFTFDLSVHLRVSVRVYVKCIWVCFLGLELSGGNAATRAEIQDEMRSLVCMLIGCRDEGRFQSQFLPDSQSTNTPPHTGECRGVQQNAKARKGKDLDWCFMSGYIVTGLQKHEAGGITCAEKYIFLSRRAQITSQTNWCLLPVPAD